MGHPFVLALLIIRFICTHVDGTVSDLTTTVGKVKVLMKNGKSYDTDGGEEKIRNF